MKRFPAPRKCLIWLFWLLVWQAASLAVSNPVILVGPVEMMQALLSLAGQADFRLTVLHSFGRISLGFAAAFAVGIGAGGLAYRIPLVREFLEPLLLAVKSVPVASFVILALIWIGSENLSVFIAFLVVVPMIYSSTLAGLKSTDPKLLEMAQVFSIPLFKRLRFIYIPAVLPYLISGCRTALGMSWKSGIAAEVIGIPDASIGEQLYYAKLYLDTGGLFAWIFVIIVASSLFESLFLWLLGRIRH